MSEPSITESESQSRTVSFAIQYANGHINIYDYMDESGDDFRSIIKKIFKTQNHYPKNISVDIGYIIKELPDNEIILNEEI